MVRQSSMSYPGQGRPNDPNLPEDSTGADRDKERPRSQNPNLREFTRIKNQSGKVAKHLVGLTG